MYIRKILAILDYNQNEKPTYEEISKKIKTFLVKTHPDKTANQNADEKEQSRKAFEFYKFLKKFLDDRTKDSKDPDGKVTKEGWFDFVEYFNSDYSAEHFIDDTLDTNIKWENEDIQFFYNAKIEVAKKANQTAPSKQSNSKQSSNNNNNNNNSYSTPPKSSTPTFDSRQQTNYSSQQENYDYRFFDATPENNAIAEILNYFSYKYINKDTHDFSNVLRDIAYLCDNITLSTKKIGTILDSFGNKTSLYENESLFTIALSKIFVQVTSSFFNLIIPILIKNKDILLKSNPVFEVKSNQIGSAIVSSLKDPDSNKEMIKNLLALLMEFNIEFDANQILEASLNKKLLYLAIPVLSSLSPSKYGSSYKTLITQIIETYPHSGVDDGKLIEVIELVHRRCGDIELTHTAQNQVPVLFQAMEKKLPAKIIVILLSKVNANSLDAEGYPPLYYVLKYYKGDLTLLKKLKALGADVNCKLRNGQTVLQFYESQPNSSQDVLDILTGKDKIQEIIETLKNGISLNVSDEELLITDLKRNPSKAIQIFQTISTLYTEYSVKLTSHLWNIFIINSSNPKVNAFINKIVNDENTLWRITFIPKDIDVAPIVEFLLNKINTKLKDSFIRLFKLARPEIVIQFVEFLQPCVYGSERSILSVVLDSHLWKIEEAKCVEFIKKLLHQCGERELTHTGILGDVVLMSALQRPDGREVPLSIIKLLVHKDIINKPDSKGNLPLYYAARRSDARRAVELLLESGADPQQIMKDGMTVLEHIKVLGEKSIIDCFEEKNETLIYELVLDIKTHSQKEKNFEKYFFYFEQYPELLVKPLNAIFSKDMVRMLSFPNYGESILDLVFIPRNMVPDSFLLKLIELVLNENLEKFTFTIVASSVSTRIYQVIEHAVDTRALEILGEFCKKNKIILVMADVFLSETCKKSKNLWKIRPFIDSFKFTTNDDCILFDIVSSYPYEAFFQADLVKLIEKIIMQCPDQLRQVKDQDSILIKALEKPIRFSTAVIKLLCCKETVDLPGKEKKSPLYYAVQQRDLELVRHFVSLGANVNYKLADGRTILEFAKANNAKPAILKCLAEGAQNSLGRNMQTSWNQNNNNNNNTNANPDGNSETPECVVR